MADTIRTLAALQAILPDNTSQQISPQDARDFLVSALGVFAQVYTQGGVTGYSVGTSPVVVAFASDGVEDGMDADAANDRITVPSGCEGDLLVVFQCSFSGTASTQWTFSLTKNGVAQNAATCGVKLNASGDMVSCGFAAVITAAAADYLQVTVTADGASKTFTPSALQLVARRIG